MKRRSNAIPIVSMRREDPSLGPKRGNHVVGHANLSGCDWSARLGGTESRMLNVVGNAVEHGHCLVVELGATDVYQDAVDRLDSREETLEVGGEFAEWHSDLCQMSVKVNSSEANGGVLGKGLEGSQ